MKKLSAILQLLAFGFILFAFVSACNRNKTEADTSGKEKSALTQFRLSLGNLNTVDQKSIFNGLTPGIRCAIWQDRLAMAMDSVAGNQKDILKKIHDKLTPELYGGDTSLAAANSEILKIVDEAVLIFENDSTKLFTILTTLGGPVTTPPLTPAPPVPDCNCNMGRNGMLRSNDCGSLSRACATANCKITWGGCGVMWLASCNGQC